MKHLTPYLLVLLASLLTACRRDLWVYTDQFRQVELITDWSEAHERPDGMTWWFMNLDNSGRNYHETTAEVTHSWLNLPQGSYNGVVFDYSPAEYSHQEFIGMSYPDSALVHQLPAADQPAANQHLYGDYAVPNYLEGIPRYTPTGMYQVGAEPELINADTIKGVHITSGPEEDLILWKDRDQYTSDLTTLTLHDTPQPLVWTLNVKVHVKGLTYMNSVRGSIAGLADGCWLSTLRHTSTPCLQALDSWSSITENDSIGYITTTVRTFGMPDLDMPPSTAITRADGDETDDQETGSEETDGETTSSEESGGIHTQIGERLQLNLLFLLRDQSTVKSYHYDVGDDCITIRDGQLEINIDIPIDYPGGIPDLPYVETSDGTGFNADVTPWADGGTADETM